MKNPVMKLVALLLLTTLCVSVLFGCGNKDQSNVDQTTTAVTEAEVEKDLFYFNIDKVLKSDPTPLKDRVSGLYTLRFLKDGKIVEFQTGRDNIATQFPNLYAVVLTFDDEGLVKKVQSVQSALGGQFVEQVKVLSIEGNQLQMETGTTLTLADDVCVYDITGREVEYGAPGQVQTNDVIAYYLNDEKIVTTAYVLRRDVDHEANHMCAHCNQNVEWLTWDGVTKLESGHYCLSEDISIESAQKLKNVDVALCLNGHQLLSKERLFELGDNAVLSVIDHAGAAGDFYGSMVGGGLKAKEHDAKELLGGSFFVSKNATLRIYGGNLCSELSTDRSRYANMGGVVYTEGTFELIDGVITGSDVGYNGGAVYVGKNGSFKMSGGVMQYGSAYKQSEYSGSGKGGTLYIHKEAKAAEITGGKLIAGIVDGHGGGLYTEISMTISNAELCGTYIDGTLQAEYGGVMWVGGKETVVELNSGTVIHSGNSVEGGNIGVRLHCTVNVNEGVRIYDGYGSRNGGNVAVFGTFNLKGGMVESGNSDGSGGNIFSYSNGNTHVNIHTGTVRNGVAARGGNICMSGTLTYEEGSILSVYGGEIYGGEATKYNGGNISLRVHSVGNITGGKITGGKAAQFGGGLSTEYTTDTGACTTLNIGGSAYIFENEQSDVYLVDKTNIVLNLDEPLTDDAKIGIEASNVSAALIDKAYETCLRAFVWTPDDKTLEFKNNQVFVK